MSFLDVFCLYECFLDVFVFMRFTLYSKSVYGFSLEGGSEDHSSNGIFLKMDWSGGDRCDHTFPQ